MYVVGANKHKGRPRWREGGLLEEFRLDDAVHSTEMGAQNHRARIAINYYYLPDRLDSRSSSGYTFGMKTAVSIPDDVFEKAEHLARRMKKSRSRLFSNALEEYIDHHAPDRVTEAMDNVWAETGTEPDPFVAAASYRILERSEW